MSFSPFLLLAGTVLSAEIAVLALLAELDEFVELAEACC